MKKYRLPILATIFFFVIFFTSFYYWDVYQNKKGSEEIRIFGESIMYQCEKNSQCIQVDVLGCCPNKDSINKKYKSYWSEKQSLYADIKVCPAIVCPSLKSGSPKCVNNRCELIDN